MQHFDHLQDVMMRSGQLIMQYFRQEIQIFCKQDGSCVTNVDIENEAFLKQELKKIVPQAGFIAEESGCENDRCDYLWVIDPLDGTKNFIKGIPHFCISVALTLHNNPIVAAIYNPVSKEFYYAEKGCGAWLNGVRKLVVRYQDFKTKGLIIVVDENKLQQIKIHVDRVSIDLHDVCISNRYFGSVVLDIVYVAAGYIDFIFFENIAWWDIAAGMLLVQEAQGMVDWQEKFIDKKMYLGLFKAGNPWIYQQLL